MRDVLAALSEQLEVPLVAIDGPPAVSPETETLSPAIPAPVPLPSRGAARSHASRSPWPIRWISKRARRCASCTGLTVQAGLAAEQEILDAIDRYYGQTAEERNRTGRRPAGEADEDLEHLRDMASEAPVIRLVNAMIAQAVEKRASDIHIEPFEKEFRVRYRIDGVLVNQDPPPRELKAAIISRVKLMAKLNIAERRLPQDGRIKIKMLGREVDLRVSTLPTLYGESVVMRLLDRSAGDFYDLRAPGLRRAHAARAWSITPRSRTAFSWSPAPPAAASPPRSIPRSSASTRPTRRSSPSKTRSNTRWTASTRSTSIRRSG